MALRLVVSSSNAKPRTVHTLLTYVPAIASYKTAKQTFQGLVTWQDATDTPKACYMLPYWELVRATKTCVSQTALALLREMFLSVVRHIVTQPDTARGIIESSHPPASLALTLQVPHIIVTPPDAESSASLNIIPVPQNAAFGNQLVVPDPEFKVINRGSPQDLFYAFQVSHVDSRHRVDETDVTANSCRVPGCLSLGGGGEEDVVALGLGPTWSG